MESPAPIPVPSRGPSASRARFAIPVLAYCGILMAVMQTVVVPLLPDLPRLTGASPGGGGRGGGAAPHATAPRPPEPRRPPSPGW